MKKIQSTLFVLFLLISIVHLAHAQDTTETDSVSIDEIRQQLQEEESGEDDSATQTAQQPQGVRATATNRNPAISAIGDFRSLYTNAGDRNWDAYVQGIELNFSSAIDPYATAEFYPVFEGEGGELNAKIEEAYIETLSLPFGLQLKAGKFRQAFGRINTVHRHSLPVIDVPVAYETFFGEAMIDQGASLSWLIPNPSFYQELIVDITRGPDESPLFTRSDSNVLMKMAHLKNFWSLTDNATLELGFSAASGENPIGETSTLAGIDITYIWKPIQFNTYKSFEWQNEIYFSNVESTFDETIKSWGMYSWMQYQLSRRWFVTGLYSYAEDPFMPEDNEQAISATFGWYATEYQKLEFGPKISSENGFSDSVFSGLFRWVFVIGEHGAHQY
jgi:hypothetical protein